MCMIQSVSCLLVCALLQTALGRVGDADDGLWWPPSYRAIKVDDAPYIAGLLDADDQTCGGSIVDAQFILTSALCVKSGSRIERAVVGVDHVDFYGTSFHQIASELCHGRFDVDPLRNDICLLKLSQPLTFNEKVAAIRLAFRDEIPQGTIVNVTRWIEKEGENSMYLQRATTAILPHSECRRVAPVSTMAAKMICADAPTDAFSSNVIGGPLTLNDRQIGILTVGPLEDGQEISFYTEVSHYLHWIYNIIGNNT